MTIFEGLTIIDRAKLPHPEWEFVHSSKDLKKFPKTKDYVGWTIRTIDIKGGKWQNMYVNWLPKKQVPKKIDEFQKKLHGKATFIIYPSWKWRIGGTVIIEKKRVVIESVCGAIVNLMRHGKVDASYFYERGKLVSYTGNKQLLSAAERRKILQASSKLSSKNIMLEWAITTRNTFIFYRIENIKEAAKLLLKKYS